MRETRLFTLHWDNSKIPNLPYDQRLGTRHCTGTHYATGIVTLDNGAVYESMFELETTLKTHGRCKVVYHDEVPEENMV